MGGGGGVQRGAASFSTALNFSFICVSMETCQGIPLMRISGNTMHNGAGGTQSWYDHVHRV